MANIVAVSVSMYSLASDSTRSSESEASSYTFIKDPGYTIELTLKESAWEAQVHDNRFPGLRRSYTATVRFEKGWSLEDFITRDSSWQSRHIHINDKREPFVYIGSAGLKGGGIFDAFDMTKCTRPFCSNDGYRCLCGYECVNLHCYEHCNHPKHMCAGCKKETRCPKYYKCKGCRSLTKCSNCCGCYENQHEENKEQEREEKLRQYQSKTEGDLRIPQDNEREEQRKQEKEKEQQDKARQEQEIQQEQLRREQERKRQQMLSENLERRRREKLRDQEERAQQERQRQEEHYRKRETALSKALDEMDSTPIDQEDTSYMEHRTSNVNTVNIDQDTEEIIFESVATGSTGQHWSDAASYPIRDTTSESDAPNLPRCTSSKSNSSTKTRTPKHSDSSGSDSDSDSDTSSDENANMSTHNLDQPRRLEDFNTMSNLQYDGQIVKKSVTASFLEGYTVDLLPEGKKSDYEETKSLINGKLAQAIPELQESIVDYFTHEDFLYPYIVKHYSVSEWISQSLINKIVACVNIDDPCLSLFRAKWFEITKQYHISDQEVLLKTLRIKKKVDNLSLLDISNVLDLIVHTGEPGYEIVCNDRGEWLTNLKINWLKPQLAFLTKFSVEEQSDLSIFLANLDWGKDMMEQFLKSIREVNTLDPILTFLFTVKEQNIPDSMVLSIITQNLLDSGNKVEDWTHTINTEWLLHKIGLSSPEIAQCVSLSLPKLLKRSCSAEFLERIIAQNIDLINANKINFSKVLELLYDYQVTEEICASAFSLLPVFPAEIWVKEIDRMISSELFENAKVYTVDEFIQSITKSSSSFSFGQLMDFYNSVKKSYLSISKMLQSVNDSDTNRFKNECICDWNKKDIIQWAKRVKSNRSSISQAELIAGVHRAVELHHKFPPRDTQILSLLVLLNPAEGMGRLAQINTGEGKSLIIAMLAAIHALQGKKVDVITTSTELSIPEVKKQKPFFECLSLTVAENSDTETKRSAYQSDILYGTSGDFQADILRSEVFGEDCRGDRNFDIVIVDEVDSMLFDNRTHSVRLSNATPGMVHLELPLAAIWERINRTVGQLITKNGETYYILEDFEKNGEEITLTSGRDWKSCAVLVKDKSSFVINATKDQLEQLLRKLDDQEKSKYEEYMNLSVDITTLEDEISKSSSDQEKERKETDCKLLKEKLNTLPWNERHPIFSVPVHLHDYAISQIPYWIQSALNAAFVYRRDAHYAVQDGRIVPIHYNETGVLQSNMVWSDGLTQFLQIKEGLRMDPEGITSNSISNVSFFKRYNSSIYGLTGTLGGKSTKNFLREVYHTDTIIIPPYQHREIKDNAHSSYLCKELAPIVLDNQNEWSRTVIDHVISHAKYNRAVLVICKFISHVNNFAEKLREKYDSEKVLTYTGAGGEKFDKTKLNSGEIIVATNIAGRGTDLETSETVEDHGGMYVAVTFLPETFRVEMQNVGRTGRSGKKGMAQLIIYDPLKTDIQDIKKDRNEEEIKANGKAIQDAEKMLLQDRLFREFCSLEKKYLPSRSSIMMKRKWVNLAEAWKKFESKELHPDKINKHVCQRIAQRKDELIKRSFDALSVKEKSLLTEVDKQNIRENANRKAKSESSVFENQYKKKVLNAFCHTQSHLPEELLSCLRNGQEFKPQCSNLAEKYDWGLYDSKGFTEYWGLWLKGKHFAEKETPLEKALSLFTTHFATPSKDRARNDKLVDNPFYHVLKGNDYLKCGNLEKAISCYNRAIGMDPDFSVNARYNKAWALLSYKENKGQLQKCAYDELKRAKNIINTLCKPNLLTLNILISQNVKNVQTSEHIQHQLNLLSQQEDYINKACGVIEEAKSKETNVKLTTKPILETLNPDDRENHKKAVDEATTDGFTHLFAVECVKPFPWLAVIGLAVIGLTAVIAGGFFAWYFSYLGINALATYFLAVPLILEGISDMIAAVRAAIKRDFDWKTFASEKALSLLTTFLTVGTFIINKLLKIDKTTIEKLYKGAQASFDKCIDKVVSTVTSGAFQKCFTVTSLVQNGKTLIENLGKIIMNDVVECISKSLKDNPLLLQLLKSDATNRNNDWKERLIDEGKSILEKMARKKLKKIISKISKIKNITTDLREFLQSAEVKTILSDLRNQVEKFIEKFNKKVQSLKPDNNQTVRQTTSTLDSSSQASSSLEIVVDSFNVEFNEIIHNLLNNSEIYLGNHGFNDADNLPNDLYREINNARKDFRNEMRKNAPSHSTTIEEQNAEEENERNNRDNEVTSRDQSDMIELNESVQRGLKRLEREVSLDAIDLIWFAAVAKAVIHVYHKDTNKLVDKVGGGDRVISLLYSPPDASDLGHWEPLDNRIFVASSGVNSSLVVSIFAQLDPDLRQLLGNARVLKIKVIDMIRKKREKANEAYKIWDRLTSIAPEGLRIETHHINVPIEPTEEEFVEIQKLQSYLSSLMIKVTFERKLKYKGGGYHFLGVGSAVDLFAKLRTAFEIKACDIEKHTNGTLSFTYNNDSYSLRKDSRPRSGGDGCSINIKKHDNPRLFYITFGE